MKRLVLVIPIVTALWGLDASAQPKPVVVGPRATAVAPSPSVRNTPTTPSVNGISVGSPTSVVDAKCREAGVKCVRTTRKVGGAIGVLDRVRIDWASGDFSRAYVTTKAGTVLSVRGKYRVVDQSRLTALQKASGQGTPRRGVLTWASPSGVVTEMDQRGQSIQYIDTKAANAKGINVTATALTSSLRRAESLRPAVTASLSPARATALGTVGRLGDLKLEATPSPQVTSPLRIPVKITLLQLRCYDENDLTSIFHGDDPYLNIVGTHTGPHLKAWFVQKTYSDVESGDHRNVNTAVFPEGDSRRFVTIGEAVGAQVTLLENDVGTDDEIDFAYPTVDYNFALANQNKTLSFTENMQGDGGGYTLTYKIEIGAGTPDPSAFAIATKYRAVDPKLYQGAYVGSVGDGASDGNLTFLASKDPAFPNGVLYGVMKDNGVTVTLQTLRLQGDSIELYARYPNGNPGTLVGYLVGDGTDRRLVGTLTRDGRARGVTLVKR